MIPQSTMEMEMNHFFIFNSILQVSSLLQNVALGAVSIFSFTRIMKNLILLVIISQSTTTLPTLENEPFPPHHDVRSVPYVF